MKQKRSNHSAEFKARIAVEAIKGLKTVQQIAAENHLHPVQVTQWKTQILESAPGLFALGRERSTDQEEAEKVKERLERKVGQLAVENDWLKKSARNWGSIREGGHGGETGLRVEPQAAVSVAGDQPQPA